MARLYKVTVELLLNVPDDVQAEWWVADAVAEILREIIQQNNTDLLDWQYAPTGNNSGHLTYEAVPTDGMEFDKYYAKSRARG